MSKCDLTFVFDRQTRVYEVGEPITGTLRVVVNKDCKCDELHIIREWRTHGRGNTATSEPDKIVFDKGDYKAGEVKEFQFSFPGRPGPLTYHGDYLNVDWYLKARVDIPWAIDSTNECDYVVIAPRGKAKVLTFGDYHPLKDVLERLAGNPLSSARAELERAAHINFGDASPFGKGGVAAAGALGGCLLIFALIFGGIAVSAAGPFGLLFGLIPAGIGGVLMFLMLRNSIAQKKLGPVKVDITPSPLVSPGREIEIAVTFTPTTEVKLNSLDLTLTGMEQVVSGSGTNKTTHTNKFCETKVTLSENTICREGEPQSFRGTFTVPDDAPFTFKAASNEVAWSVDVHVDIPMWPDWVNKHSIVIYPLEKDGPESRGVQKAKIVVRPSESTRPSPSLAAAPLSFSVGSPVPSKAFGEDQPEPIAAKAPASPFGSDFGAANSGRPSYDDPPTEEPEYDEPESEPEAEEAGGAGSLEELADSITRLAGATFSSEREKIIAESAGLLFDLTIVTSSIESTSTFDANEDYKGGKTLVGKVDGLDREVAVQLTKESSAELSFSASGESFDVSAALVSWKSLYDRPVLEARA